MHNAFTLIAAVIDTFVIASFLFYERSQARTNLRPMRRAVVVSTCVGLAVGLTLIVLSFIPVDSAKTRIEIETSRSRHFRDPR